MRTDPISPPSCGTAALSAAANNGATVPAGVHAAPAATNGNPLPSGPIDTIGRVIADHGPLLALGAVAAAQLVPGVAEGEGLAAGVAIAARAGATAGQKLVAGGLVGGVFVAAAKSGTDYVMTLAHDALMTDPHLKPAADAFTAVDSRIHRQLGIAKP